MFHFLPQILREYIVTSVVYINGRVGRSEAEIQHFQGSWWVSFHSTHPTLAIPTAKPTSFLPKIDLNNHEN
ncbi:hypothetical protein BGP_1322 [Beggiatoa sp. PS]|nr:hypothetical protein BGP_1322 [Beggiatoa sp. PS]